LLGFVSAGGRFTFVTVHVKLFASERLPSDAVTDTGYDPAVEGIPAIAPVAAFSARPGGSPVAA
jgi:hypothetical protein